MVPGRVPLVFGLLPLLGTHPGLSSTRLVVDSGSLCSEIVRLLIVQEFTGQNPEHRHNCLLSATYRCTDKDTCNASRVLMIPTYGSLAGASLLAGPSSKPPFYLGHCYFSYSLFPMHLYLRYHDTDSDGSCFLKHF